jgi:hypothetical protein
MQGNVAGERCKKEKVKKKTHYTSLLAESKPKSDARRILA